jgi:hypothetical protein
MTTPARPPTELFDWKATCPQDVDRVFPAVIGKGRGCELTDQAIREARRKLQERPLTEEAETA